MRSVFRNNEVMLVSKQITKNFLSLFLSNVLGQVFALWAIVRIARVFGPEGFGKFSFAQVVALYFLCCADFGLQTLGARTIAQEKGDISGHVRDITFLRVILALLLFIVLVICALLLATDVEVRLLIIVSGLALFPSAILLEWVYQGLEQMQYVGLARVLKGLAFGVLVYFVVRDPHHLIYAAGFYVVGIAVAAGVLIGVYCRTFGLPRGRPDVQSMKTTFMSAIPLAAGAFIGQINYNFGTLALGLFLSADIVGVYSAAYKIILFLLGFVVIAAANATFPLLVRSYKESTKLFSETLKRLLRPFILIAIPVGVGGTILASRIVGFLYSDAYRGSTIVLQVAIWMIVLMICRVIFENALVASGNRRQYAAGFAAAGAVTILGNVLLIPVLGLVAPAIVAVLSECTLLVWFMGSTKFIRAVYVAKIGLKPCVAGLLMGLALWYLPVNLFLAIAVGAVIYAGLLLLFRCISVEEVLGYVHSLVQ